MEKPTKISIDGHDWKYYTISLGDVGKTIIFCDCGIAVIKDEVKLHD